MVNADPTRDEMLDFLRSEWGADADEFDLEAAIYWFAYEAHGGQWSNLYSALSTSPYRPSPIASGPEEESTELMMVESLRSKYLHAS